jgi:hypothetical protein
VLSIIIFFNAREEAGISNHVGHGRQSTVLAGQRKAMGWRDKNQPPAPEFALTDPTLRPACPSYSLWISTF